MNLPSDGQFTLWGEKIRQSDQHAFDQLFRSFYPFLMRFAMRYTHDEAAAKDVVQDCFVKLWNTRRRINPERSLKSYLYTMVRNRALNVIRGQAGLEVSHQLASENSVYEELEIQDNTQPGLHDFFKQWIGQLPDRQKEAFELSRFEGLDHEEISEVMDISPKTVNNHIVAALSFLKERYSNHKPEGTK